MNKSEKFWDRMAKGSQKPVKQFGKTTIETIEYTRKHLNHDDLVLDYGCGTGTITIGIAPHVKEIIAIDLSSKMIEAAIRNDGEHHSKNIQFYHSTLSDERLKENSFDVILAFNILHVLEDPQKDLKIIYELIKPGGFFISATPCMGEKNRFISILLRLLGKTGLIPKIQNYKTAELENLIAVEKFQIEKTDNLFNSPLNHFIVAKKF